MFTIILALFISSSVFATGTQEYAKVCGTLHCTEKMKQIENNFLQGIKLNLADMPQLYSGACFHLSWEYNPDHEHYGIKYFYKKADDNKTVYSEGVYNFFPPENPYKNFTIADAMKAYPPAYKFSLEDYPTYSAINFAHEYPNIAWQSWLTVNPINQNLNIISAWTPDHWVFCEMQRHTK